MPITYGMNLARTRGVQQLSGIVQMSAYTTHAERADVFLSYRHGDQVTALQLAMYLDQRGRQVFIDIHDDTLDPGDIHLDEALIKAITNADTMVIVVSDGTQGSWWVPWEIGVSTPYRKPKALYKPLANQQLPSYLQKLPRLQDFMAANKWVVENRSRS